MPYDYERVRKLPVDARIVDEINRTPIFLREQGSPFMSHYGGASTYIAVSKLTGDERVAFYAVQDGFDNAADIAGATGMSESDASKALSSLQTKGYVSSGQVAK